jgi:hypothetical protein
MYYLGVYDIGPAQSAAILITVPPLVLVLLFHLVLHVQYSIVNRNTVLKISKNKEKLTIITGNSEFELYSKDVSAYEIYLPKSINRKSVGMFPWDEYFYTKIKMKCGGVVYITSLLYPDVEVFSNSNKAVINESNYSFVRCNEIGL